MPEINYSARVINVGARTMDIEYSNPTYGTLIVGARKPLVGETQEQVIAEYSPVLYWLQQSQPLADVAPGTVVQGTTVVPEPPVPLTPEEELEIWRESMVISKFQAHETLRNWDLYDQVVGIVTQIGDPVERAFHNAGEWQRTSQTITSLFSLVTMPDGNPPTPEVLDQFFAEAGDYVI